MAFVFSDSDVLFLKRVPYRIFKYKTSIDSGFENRNFDGDRPTGQRTNRGKTQRHFPRSQFRSSHVRIRDHAKKLRPLKWSSEFCCVLLPTWYRYSQSWDNCSQSLVLRPYKYQHYKTYLNIGTLIK